VRPLKNSYRAPVFLVVLACIAALTLALTAGLGAQVTSSTDPLGASQNSQSGFGSLTSGQLSQSPALGSSSSSAQAICSGPYAASNPSCAVFNPYSSGTYGNNPFTDLYGGALSQSTTGGIDQSSQQNGQSAYWPMTAQGRLAFGLLAPPQMTEFQRGVQRDTGRTLPIFGESIFNYFPTTFAPANNIPVSPDYLIGPGDEIRIQIWGQSNFRSNYTVDRTGTITPSLVGPIHVAGLKFSQLTDFLRAQYARIYRNFDINVNLGSLRSIEVFVVGQVRVPGSYTISSLSTVLNAVFASGGPLPQGSLREIQLKRGSETIVHFDLYDLLLHGDKSKDVPLLPGDVIFIPPVGPQVAVLGSVKTPAIYEIRDEKTFQQVVELAGGLTNTASGAQVHIDRIEGHTQRGAFEINLNTNASDSVQDGDIVTVLSVIDRFKNAVTLRGNVADPGRYAWHEGMRISDLIPNKDALTTRDYYHRMMNLGQNVPTYLGPQESANTSSTNTASAADGSNSSNPPAASSGVRTAGVISSQPGRSAADYLPSASTGVGATSVGASLTFSSPNFPAKTDVILSGPDIDWTYAVIQRQNASNLTTTLIPFNLGSAVLQKDPSQDLQLLPGDVVTVFSTADVRVPSEQQTKFVKLEGEFAAAGVYSTLPGETLRQLIKRAGGLTPDADLFASDFSRESVRRLQQQRLLEFADQLDTQIAISTSAAAATAVTAQDAQAAQAAAQGARSIVTRLRQAQPSGRVVLQLKPDSSGIDAIPDIPLQDGDQFIVPLTPATVSVEGQVYNANAFLYEKDRRVKDYLRRAGGPDRSGDRKREFVLRADGSVVSRQYGSLAERSLFVSRSFDDIVLYPGDTVVVPPVIQKGAVLRNLSNISSIISGFGLGAAAVNVLR
jgi:polysaccharide export outer membrane protein